MKEPHCIALIPARFGSKRVHNKNILPLAGHPLIAYSIYAAIHSGIFSEIIVSTDHPDIAHVARTYGATVPFLRPAAFATDTSPDIEWVDVTIKKLMVLGIHAPFFFLLRPTSPFRTSETIQRAWEQFLADTEADSLRAVELCTQHPAKMWQIAGNRMTQVMNNPNSTDVPWHSMQYQSLPQVYVQNASLEIAHTSLVLDQGTISGDKILPFLTEGYEGYDINTEKDVIYAQYLVETGKVRLPTI